MSAAVIELLLGLARTFPNTMTAMSLIGGVALGRTPWVIMGAGAISLALLIIVLQLITGSIATSTRTMDAAVIQACSMLPIATNSTYHYVPSLWTAITVYFVVYILMNAVAVYTAPSTKLPEEAMPVQHRKSIGVVSIFAIILLAVTLLIVRLQTGCEYVWRLGPMAIPVGFLLAIGLGIGWAVVMRTAASASGDPNVSDVHGVMIGLQPGTLRTHPLACKPAAM